MPLSFMQPQAFFFQYADSTGQEEPQQRGCSKEFINNLPVNKEDTDCVICMDHCKAGYGIELPCGHAFDKCCLEKWLVDHDSCPTCRAKLDQ